MLHPQIGGQRQYPADAVERVGLIQQLSPGRIPNLLGAQLLSRGSAGRQGQPESGLRASVIMSSRPVAYAPEVCDLPVDAVALGGQQVQEQHLGIRPGEHLSHTSGLVGTR
ncbi:MULTISPECIES: hypothetical protein [Streptomyces]|uniref:hypothetical protein n=1 Tax=Streptomyces TaxID=1883 RepID=UPI0033B0C336